MAIVGFQSTTLLDFPGKMACTVFLAGCQFRCPWCHNWELIDGRPLTAMPVEDLAAFLKKRKGLLEGICFTGGEPLMARELESLMGLAKREGYAVKLDTNGLLTDRLQNLVGRGLVDYVAMDIKNCPNRYAETVGLKQLNMEGIEESVRFLMSGPVDYEFRTTVIEQFHDEEGIRAMGEWLSGADRLFLQAFEMTDHVPDRSLAPPGREKIQLYRKLLAAHIGKVEVRN